MIPVLVRFEEEEKQGQEQHEEEFVKPQYSNETRHTAVADLSQ